MQRACLGVKADVYSGSVWVTIATRPSFHLQRRSSFEVLQGVDGLTSSQRSDWKMEHGEQQPEERQKMLRDASALKAFLKRSDTPGGPNL